jgi:hypothetical protein
VEKVKEVGTEIGSTVATKTGLAGTQPTTAPTSQPAAASTTAPPPPAAPAADAPKPGEPPKAVKFEWMVGRFPVGDLITEVINFLIIALAVFLLIVKLIGGTVKRVGGKAKPGEPTTKECPECLSIIPIKARRCSHCTAVLEPAPEAKTG